MSMQDKQALRVIQKNLVYLTNLDPTLSHSDLKSPNFLAQYGTIKKIITRINQQGKTQSAYVTYSTDQEALDCLRSISETWYNGF